MARIKKEISSFIIDLIKSYPLCSSKNIYDGLEGKFSYATIKRTISHLLKQDLIIATGRGKSTKYNISSAYELIQVINTDEYFKKEIDERVIKNSFNHVLVKDTLNTTQLFSDAELKHLIELQNQYKKDLSKLTKSEYKKELEHLAIDLSWKSSQIEGNTYSLLETERLLKEQKTAAGKTKDEATMLLNHKSALDFIISHPRYLKPLSISRIEDIHSLLVKNLNIMHNVRKRRVGISGTNYKPLDNEFQIREAMQDMCKLVNKQKNTFTRALLVLVLISYIQAFDDGNKRTARIISNAILVSNGHCPISFRTVDSVDYKKALLIFYEQNNVSAFKKIFIEQFEFAVKTYF